MSREKVKELLRRRSTKIGSVVLAAALVFGGGMWATRGPEVVVPELVSFVDPVEAVVIEGEDTPLAGPKVTTTTKTTTKKKKIKLKKKSKKTYTKKGKTTTKKSSATKKSGNTITRTEVVTVTSIQYKFKKGSKTKTQITTVKTTTTTTVTTTGSSSSGTTSGGNANSGNNKNVAGATNPSTTTVGKPIAGITQKRDAAYAANKVDSRVTNAFNELGFQIVTDAAAAKAGGYTGKFEADTRKIIVTKMDGTVYHEMGHFLSFIVGNYDRTAGFKNVYAAEKDLYGEWNRDYAISSASEYFAESFCQYVLDPGGLKSTRPQTFNAITDALSKVTDAQVKKVWAVYGSTIWK